MTQEQCAASLRLLIVGPLGSRAAGNGIARRELGMDAELFSTVQEAPPKSPFPAACLERVSAQGRHTRGALLFAYLSLGQARESKSAPDRETKPLRASEALGWRKHAQEPSPNQPQRPAEPLSSQPSPRRGEGAKRVIAQPATTASRAPLIPAFSPEGRRGQARHRSTSHSGQPWPLTPTL